MSEVEKSRRGRWLLLPGLGLLTGFGLARSRERTHAASISERSLGPAAEPVRKPMEIRESVLRELMPGEPGTGGYYAAWGRGTADASSANHIEFQYAGIEHQTDAAMSGMWLFLATELLFFGGLFLIYAIYRSGYPAGTAEASRHANLIIGTINTVLLLTSSAIFSYGLGCARTGRNRPLFWTSIITGAIGVTFLLLKAYEWKDDFDKHLFPGPDFGITGTNAGGAQLFWSFYFIATALHAVHMIVGIGLVGWVGWNARKERYSPSYYTPAEVVGLYWSFVDMVWLVLYPSIYLVGGAGS